MQRCGTPGSSTGLGQLKPIELQEGLSGVAPTFAGRHGAAQGRTEEAFLPAAAGAGAGVCGLAGLACFP